jgi:hypothetical protein
MQKKKELNYKIERDFNHLIIHLFAFGKEIGEVEIYTQTDTTDKLNQYLLTYRHYVGGEFDEDVDPVILEEGHRKEGLIQQIR